MDRNAYSVNSRLIGQKVQVRLYVQHLEVWYGQKKVEHLERLRGRNQHRVDYRHVIDWLVRKPGAFADYRYRADLFPSSLFRVAYDRLRSQHAPGADKQYLKILELAARESESLVEGAISRLCELGEAMSFEAVGRWCSRARSWRRRRRRCGWIRWTCWPTTSCWTGTPSQWVQIRPARTTGVWIRQFWGCAMSKATDELTGCLKELHLPTARACYGELADRARQEDLKYEGYLLEVMARECQGRRHNKMERLLRESRLPIQKSLGAFDLKRLPARVSAVVRTLVDGSFADRRENVLAFGNPGSGKTHLLCGIGQELVRAGRTVYFSSTNLLVQELLAAKRELKLARMIKRLSRYQVLILDDLGYVQQSREEMEVLFTLLAERYERGSVMITSNLAFSKWESIFKDAMTTAAAIDRLVHHSVILELNLPSYRVEQARKSRSAAADAETAAAAT